mgnify:CR=1 FL=1
MKIVTDNIYFYTWTRDNLVEKLEKFNKDNEKKLFGKFPTTHCNGFMRYKLVADGLNLLTTFCADNDVELVSVLPLEVDMERNIKKLMLKCGIEL